MSTIHEFRTWLNQLVIDKKGALPDMNDWKAIRQELDKVREVVVRGRNLELYEAQLRIEQFEKKCDDLERDCSKLVEEIQNEYDEYIRELTLEENNNGKTETRSDATTTSSSDRYFGDA